MCPFTHLLALSKNFVEAAIQALHFFKDRLSITGYCVCFPTPEWSLDLGNVLVWPLVVQHGSWLVVMWQSLFSDCESTWFRVAAGGAIHM